MNCALLSSRLLIITFSQVAVKFSRISFSLVCQSSRWLLLARTSSIAAQQVTLARANSPLLSGATDIFQRLRAIFFMSRCSLLAMLSCCVYTELSCEHCMSSALQLKLLDRLLSFLSCCHTHLSN
jgi:hypothetical protein